MLKPACKKALLSVNLNKALFEHLAYTGQVLLGRFELLITVLVP